SGTAPTYALGQDALPSFQLIANVSGCSAESTEKTADCIKNLDMETILTIAKFSLITGGHFLQKSPSELLLQHQLLTVPFMTGVNNHEGTSSSLLPPALLPVFFSVALHLDQPTSLVLPQFFTPFLLFLLKLFYSHLKLFFTYSYAGAPVYLYEFQHSPSFLKDKRPSFVKSDHGDEIYSVFGAGDQTSPSQQLNKIMMSYWGNFARTGSPNGQGLVHWPKYGEKEDYLAIDAKNQNVFQGLKKDKFVVLTQTPPENLKEQKDSRHSEKLVFKEKLGQQCFLCFFFFE
uniref:Carboxylesterase type B domain-containing protein n=1 Tax=Takifugu rubripes TaxID=31033 RepID=A0A674PBM5_TAKRU